MGNLDVWWETKLNEKSDGREAYEKGAQLHSQSRKHKLKVQRDTVPHSEMLKSKTDETKIGDSGEQPEAALLLGGGCSVEILHV